MVDINSPVVVGDVVTLKSGGCPMTVQGFEKQPVPAGSGFASDRMVRCVWIDRVGAAIERLFWPHVLAKVEDKGVPEKERVAPPPRPPLASDKRAPAGDPATV
jgi:uncharacterized protein YodC (DUF2158 family)